MTTIVKRIDLTEHRKNHHIDLVIGQPFAPNDHGSIPGLGDDDHTQYFLLAGRSGGQIGIGGTAAGDDLTLQSTSNATKGQIIWGTSSIYDEVNDRLGLGTTPTGKLHVVGSEDVVQGIFKANSTQTSNIFEIQDSAGNADVFVVSSSERVGIGTSAPSSKFTIQQATDTHTEGVHIKNTSGVAGKFYMTSFNALAYTGMSLVTYAANLKLGDDREINFGNNIDYTLAYHSSTDTFRFVDGADPANNVRVLINAAGNIGVKEVSPAAQLHVTGDTDQVQAILQANATQTSNIFEVQDAAGNADIFNVDGSENVKVFNILTSSGGRIKEPTRVTTTYTILTSDDEVFGNTDAGAFTITLPAGTEGEHHRVINTGSSGNLLTLAPNGAEHLVGANSNFTLNDGESLDLVYNTTDGWY